MLPIRGPHRAKKDISLEAVDELLEACSEVAGQRREVDVIGKVVEELIANVGQALDEVTECLANSDRGVYAGSDLEKQKHRRGG